MTVLKAEDFLGDDFSTDSFVINARRTLSLEALRKNLGLNHMFFEQIFSCFIIFMNSINSYLFIHFMLLSRPRTLRILYYE